MPASNYEKLCHECWIKTRCLEFNLDCSEDHPIKPEGLSEYQVPPSSLAEPAPNTALSKLNKVSARETDVTESNNKINEIAESDEFFIPNEDNGERNMFPFINNLLSKMIRGTLREETVCKSVFAS